MGKPCALVPERPLSRAADLSTFVTVGNATQAFDRLLDAARGVSASLPRPVVVQRGVSRIDDPAWETHDYLPMQEFERLVRESSVLIMHAGAGSVIHAVRAGKRPIVMPRRMRLGEHVDDHQVEFAEALAQAGYVHLASEPGDLTTAIAAAVAGSRDVPRDSAQPLIQHVSALLGLWAAEREAR
jgi:UDP-N-acetylglucosamine transferase subunit ALG13